MVDVKSSFNDLTICIGTYTKSKFNLTIQKKKKNVENHSV